MRKAPTRVLVVATSLVVVAASALRSPLPLSRERVPTIEPDRFTLTKECPPSTMQGQIGDYCTVTSSNVPAISVGTKIFYAHAAGMTSWTATSSSTPGPARPRPVIALSILRPASGGARCQAEPGPSTASVLASMSRTWAGSTGPGTGRTGSARTTTRSSDSGAQGRAPIRPSRRSLNGEAGWARLDSNQGPTDYESAALTN